MSEEKSETNMEKNYAYIKVQYDNNETYGSCYKIALDDDSDDENLEDDETYKQLCHTYGLDYYYVTRVDKTFWDNRGKNYEFDCIEYSDLSEGIKAPKRFYVHSIRGANGGFGMYDQINDDRIICNLEEYEFGENLQKLCKKYGLDNPDGKIYNQTGEIAGFEKDGELVFVVVETLDEIK